MKQSSAAYYNSRKNMRILSETWKSQSEGEHGSYALFNIDAELAKEILARKELFQMVKAKDKDLNSMSFWDSRVEFFSCYAGQEIEEKLGEEENELFQEQRWLEVPASFTLNEEHATRTDTERLVMDEEHFYWRSSDHYCSDTYETEGLTYEMLLPKAKTS